MNFNDAYPSNYLRSVELLGRELTVMVTDVKREMVEDPNRNTNEEKTVFYFHKEKPMIINVTNAKRIARMIRNQDLTHAMGMLLTLYSEDLLVAGNPTTGLRVQVRKPNYKGFLECSNDLQDLRERMKLINQPDLKEFAIKLSEKWKAVN